MFRIRVILSLACLFVSDVIAEPSKFDAFERSIPELQAAMTAMLIPSASSAQSIGLCASATRPAIDERRDRDL